MRMLDLFAGRLGWSKAFLARGWKVTAVDLVEPPEILEGVDFERLDVLKICFRKQPIRHFNTWGSDPNPFWEWCMPDFICASPPCEEFSVHGMKHFHPNPKYPELGIKLFNHTREICEASGVSYVMENVRAAQQFVGKAVHHCGPFYLWGSGVPPLMPTGGIRKGIDWPRPDANGRRNYRRAYNWHSSKSGNRKLATAKAATIPPELANCVAEYAERLIEAKVSP